MPMVSDDHGGAHGDPVRFVRYAAGLIVLIVGWLGFVAGASASPADFTWQGPPQQDDFWSAGQNWAGGVAPASGGTVGTLTFPGPCQFCNPFNDLNDLSVDGLVLGGDYGFAGSQINLGAGGITMSSDAARVNMNMPLALSANQTWSLDGASLNLFQVSGQARLEIDLASGAGLTLNAETETGSVSIVGANSADSGSSAMSNGTTTLFQAEDLNGLNGHPVTLTDAALTGGGWVGALTSHGGYVYEPAGIVHVVGGAQFDSASALELSITADGTDPGPGNSYSQLSATGPVDLGGARLILGGGLAGSSCPPVSVGDVDTIVSTTGALTGTFGGIPDGTVVPIECTGSSTEPTVRINYTAHAVTATIVSVAPGTFATQAWMSLGDFEGVTNQPVTLLARVNTFVGGNHPGPSGSMKFMAFGAQPLPGCAASPVTATSEYEGTATCQATFAAADASTWHWIPVIVQFIADPGSIWRSSDIGGLPVNVVVRPATTTTTLQTVGPSSDGDFVYAATVTPAFLGRAAPTGTVDFADDGVPVPGCTDAALTVKNGTGLAFCKATPSDVGEHRIAASYSGDRNFTGSVSNTSSIEAPPSSAGPVAVTAVQLTGLAERDPALSFEVHATRAGRQIQTVNIAPPNGLNFSRDVSALRHHVTVGKAVLSLAGRELRITLRKARGHVRIAIGSAALNESRHLAMLASEHLAKPLFHVRVRLTSSDGAARSSVVSVPVR